MMRSAGSPLHSRVSSHSSAVAKRGSVKKRQSMKRVSSNHVQEHQRRSLVPPGRGKDITNLDDVTGAQDRQKSFIYEIDAQPKHVKSGVNNGGIKQAIENAQRNMRSMSMREHIQMKQEKLKVERGGASTSSHVSYGAIMSSQLDIAHSMKTAVSPKVESRKTSMNRSPQMVGATSAANPANASPTVGRRGSIVNNNKLLLDEQSIIRR